MSLRISLLAVLLSVACAPGTSGTTTSGSSGGSSGTGVTSSSKAGSGASQGGTSSHAHEASSAHGASSAGATSADVAQSSSGPSVPGCGTAADCPDQTQSCLAPGEFGGCGICRGEVATCTSDADCNAVSAGTVCEISSPRDCLCSSQDLCRANCSDTGCAEGWLCGADGHCTPMPCTQSVQCPSNFSCFLTEGVMPPMGYCGRAVCDGDAGCGDSACVNGRCYAEPGTCTFPVP